MTRTAAPGRQTFLLGLLATLIGIPSGAASAALIQFDYGGVITSADLSTGVAPGTHFSGTFAYDPTTTRFFEMMIEGLNQYTYGHMPGDPSSIADGSGLTLQIGGRTVLANPGGVQVAVSEIEYPGQWGYANASGDPASPFTTVGISNANVDGGPLRVALDLKNPTRSVFGSLDPPTTLNLADFPQATLDVTELTNPGVKSLYTGTIDSLVEIPAPEPAWATLLCLGAIGWFARSSRRQRRGPAPPA
jgi:hypothetical protein